MGSSPVRFYNLEDQIRYQPILFGLLDKYPASSAYSVARQLSEAHTSNLIRVRRASDNAEQDIGQVAGELDTASLSTFCSGTNGFVVTIYDQQGSNDATQSSASDQYQIYDSATGVTTLNGKPAIINDSSLTMHYNLASPITKTTVSFVAEAANVNDFLYIIGEQAINSVIRLNNKNWQIDAGASSFTVDGTWYKNGVLQTIDFSALAQQLHFVYNTNIKGSTTTLSTNFLNRSFRGYIQEIIFWGTDESANRLDIEADINNFYSIY